MASWFRAAEELLEVVDRKAKKVVSEHFGDESPGQNTDSGVLGRVLATSPLGKSSLLSSVQLETKGDDAIRNGSYESIPDGRISSNQQFGDRTLLGNATSTEMPDSSAPEVEIKSGPDMDSRGEKSESDGENSERESGIKNGIMGETEESVHTSQSSEVEANANHSDNTQSLEMDTVKCQFVAENGAVTVELVSNKDNTIETGKLTADKLASTEVVAGEESEDTTITGEAVRSSEVKQKETEIVQSSEVKQKEMEIVQSSEVKQKEREIMQSSEVKLAQISKVEEQLDEAQGLLKTAASTGQSKEARLARVCAGLSSRLQEYKAENAQLEELLRAEREQRLSLGALIKQFQQEVVSARASASAVEEEMGAALSSKNSEIETLANSVESMKRHIAASEGQIATLQATLEAMSRSREVTEAEMIKTLREQLTSSEHEIEEERAAHNATRKNALRRETELEQQVAEATGALMRMQRLVDERTQKATELEHKVSMLELDCATLNQELQEMEAKLKREQKRMPEESAQKLQLQVWKEDAERARQAQRELEGKLSTMEAETQKLRVELASARRDADQYTAQAQIELEKRFRELTELLYLKQTQLEAVTSEKAAAVWQLEKEMKRLKEAQAEAERHRKLRHSIGWDEENDVKALESLNLQQRRLSPSIQRAAKFLDSSALSAGRFLWRRPLARLVALFYLVFVHLFLMYLLHRLQDQALSFKEEMEAAGVAKQGMQ